MKQIVKRSFALLMAIVMCLGLIPVIGGHAHAAEGETMVWTKVELSEIQPSDTVAITMTKGSDTWALYNANGTSGAPTAVPVTVDGSTMTCEDNATISWNIVSDESGLIIYTAGSTSTWLYSTNSNNGVRVGGTTDSKYWTVDSASGYLKNIYRSRYMGVYNNADWRTYTTLHANIAGETLSFWKLVPAGCDHDWADATCTAPKTCKLCEETEGEALGHDWVDATCTTPKTCDRCTVTEGEALGHDYDEEGVCTVCGAVEGCVHENTEVLPGEAATCTKDGLTEGSKCADCHEILDAQEVIPATGHSYEAVVTDPTCTEDGYTTYTCSVCSDSYTADEVTAPGHNYVDGACTVCEELEPVAKTITFDDTSKRTEYSTSKQVWQENGITVTNDKASASSAVNEAFNPIRLYAGSSITIECLNMTKIEVTCNSNSYATSLKSSITDGDATVSGSVVTITLPAAANTYTVAKLSAQVRVNSMTVYAKPCQHTNTETLEAKAATCTETGLTEGSKCVDCGEVLVAQNVIPAAGHSYETVVTAPTCTEGGYTTYTCSACDDTYTGDETSATGHTYVEGICEDCGAEENCAHTNTEVLPAREPTCTETGLTAGEKCTDCNEVLTAQEEIPATGHSHEAVVTAPTCTEDGYTTYTCSCGDSYTDDEVPATGHNFVDGTCTVCDQAQVTYVYSQEGYIYNWGTREVDATSLSPNAETFYTGQNTYEYFAGLAGGTGTANAPSSALYSALKTFMSGKQTWITSYDDTRSLYQYTDCENSGNPKTISAFYSGMPIGPAWDNGSTWNREHVWPNSKGDASGQGENDIMMLRPAVASNNSSRGNKAYGETNSSSYYNPNSESNGQHDLRGDVSRIVLYVYVRWGNTGSMWGADGVIESLDVLLKWIEEDPVDTWELGRNDSVQSMTGTRNVFVDYPELAFLLFGEEIPNDMTTPSGEAKDTVACQHNYVAGTPVAPTCTTEGYTVYTCSICSRSYTDDKVPAIGHNYANGVCTDCGQAEPESQSVKIYYPADQLYLTATASGKKLAAGNAAEAAVWEMAEHEQGYVSFSVNGKYLTSGATGNELTLAAELTDCGLWEVITADGGVLLHNVGANYNGNYNQYLEYYSGFTTYGFNESNASIYTFQLETVTGGEVEPPVECAHANTQVLAGKAPTCTEAGLTEGSKCADCGEVLVAQTEIPATGHNYVDGTCTECGQAEPNGTQATITFDDTSKRLEQTASKQVWTENGITVTNEKGASTSNIIDSKNPVRFYKNSTVIIAYPGMTKIEVTCNTYSDYASALQSSITDGTVTVSGNVVTITLPAAADSYTVVLSGGQVRVDSITVYAEEGGSGEPPVECTHANTQVLEGKAPTCTESGLTEGSKCVDCGAVLVAQSEIPATGHNYVDGKCTVCQADEVLGPVYVTEVAAATAYKLGLYSTDKGSAYYFVGTMSGYYGATSTDYEQGVNVYLEETAGGYHLYFTDASGAKQYINLVASGTHLNFTFATTAGSVFTWDADRDALCTTVGTETCYMGTYSTYVTMGVLKASNLKDSDYIARLYIMDTGSDEPPVECTHANTQVLEGKAPTCTESGLTEGSKCTDCGAVLVAQAEIPATGHNYFGGICTVCGAAENVVVSHRYTSSVLSMPTCETAGVTLYTCIDCGDSYTITTKATGHNLVDGVCTICGEGTSVEDGKTTTIEKVENEDGSVTETTTVTEVTEGEDGSTVTSEVVTETVTREDGTTETVTTETLTTELADGTTATTVTDSTGTVTSEVTISEDAVAGSAESGEAVALPVPEIVASSENAATISINFSTSGDDSAVKVELPVSEVNKNAVIVIVHEDGTEEIVKKSALTEDGLAFEVSENVTVKVVDNSKEFEDVNTGDWFSEAVSFASSREILNGVGDGKFSPKTNMTRGQLAVMLHNLENNPEAVTGETFSDVGDIWYAEAVEWAAASKIILGNTDGSFRGDEEMTREQLITFLYRYAGSPKLEGGSAKFDAFTDSDSVSDWAVDAMNWAVEMGIINGVGNNTINPMGSATREQVAQVLMNFINAQ